MQTETVVVLAAACAVIIALLLWVAVLTRRNRALKQTHVSTVPRCKKVVPVWNKRFACVSAAP